MWIRYFLIRPIGIAFSKKKKYNVKYSGTENVPYNGPFIVVMNHQTNIDVFATGLGLKKTMVRSRMRPWAKIEIGKGKEGPLGMILYYYLGVIPINREETDIEETMRRSLKCLKRGEIVAIFPEGTKCKPGELGWFKYGVANLARAMPVPILPVAVYRRKEDRGIQVNYGKPFFMPPIKKKLEIMENIEEKVEDTILRHAEELRQWSMEMDVGKKSMKFIKKMTGLIIDFIYKQEFTFDRFCKIAEDEDNEYIRDKIFELLPEGWVKLEK